MLDNNVFLTTYIQIVLNIVFYLLIIINKHVLVNTVSSQKVI